MATTWHIGSVLCANIAHSRYLGEADLGRRPTNAKSIIQSSIPTLCIKDERMYIRVPTNRMATALSAQFTARMVGPRLTLARSELCGTSAMKHGSILIPLGNERIVSGRLRQAIQIQDGDLGSKRGIYHRETAAKSCHSLVRRALKWWVDRSMVSCMQVGCLQLGKRVAVECMSCPS